MLYSNHLYIKKMTGKKTGHFFSFHLLSFFLLLQNIIKEISNPHPNIVHNIQYQFPLPVIICEAIVSAEISLAVINRARASKTAWSRDKNLCLYS